MQISDSDSDLDMQDLIDLDSSSGNNYYKDPSKNILPTGYPSININTLPHDYPMTDTNDYWSNSTYDNYPSLWRGVAPTPKPYPGVAPNPFPYPTPLPLPAPLPVPLPAPLP
jgi:hypothetical protein